MPQQWYNIYNAPIFKIKKKKTKENFQRRTCVRCQDMRARAPVASWRAALKVCDRAHRNPDQVSRCSRNAVVPMRMSRGCRYNAEEEQKWRFTSTAAYKVSATLYATASTYFATRRLRCSVGCVYIGEEKMFFLMAQLFKQLSEFVLFVHDFKWGDVFFN